MFVIKPKRQLAFNKFFNFLVVIGIVFGGGAVECFVAHDIPMGIFFGLVALLFMILPALFTPYCYLFDSEGVSLCYVFFPVERYLWDDIRAITVEDIGGHRRFPPIDFFYASIFCLRGNNVGKSRFYMQGHIRKSFRTKHLLETYWDGTITGYLFEDLKAWINKRKQKRQKEIHAHFTDEIVAMERETRAQVRKWLQPLIAQAKQHNLDIHATYVYVTRDFEEHRSRPREGYTYTLDAEIAPPGETDEDRIYVMQVELLYVRLGKTAYRGVKNNHAKEELESAFADLLSE